VRSLLRAPLIACLATVLSAGTESSIVFDHSVRPFFSKNCYGCHNPKLKSGSLNLELYRDPASLAQDRDTWERVLRKIRWTKCRPRDRPRPNQADVKAVTDWIESEFERVDRLAKPDPGHVTARRLNRAEYNNTVRDLLGVDVHPRTVFRKTIPAMASTISETCCRFHLC